MYNTIIVYIYVFCLTIIYTFIEDINFEKNKEIQIVVLCIALLGILTIDIPGIQILIMLLFLKFVTL
jgi:hypothetical protein